MQKCKKTVQILHLHTTMSLITGQGVTRDVTICNIEVSLPLRSSIRPTAVAYASSRASVVISATATHSPSPTWTYAHATASTRTPIATRTPTSTATSGISALRREVANLWVLCGVTPQSYQKTSAR
jgi:hypothetical protein